MNKPLQQRRKQLGLSQRHVADLVGVSEATISRWENGQIADMKRKYIRAYADALQTTTDFIMTGEAGEEAAPVPAGFEPLPAMKMVPLIGSIACGTPITAEQNIERYIGVPAAWHADFALTCHGDSMSPTIRDGDIVCIRSQGQIAAVRIGEEATLKHFHRQGDAVMLLADNTAVCPPMIYTGPQLAEVQIEGRAVGLCRSL